MARLKRSKSRAEKITLVALALNRRPSTIRGWIAEGCDIDDPESIVAFYQANQRRRRNRGPLPSETLY